MKIIESTIQNGDIRAQLQCTPEEVESYIYPHEAIEKAIWDFIAAKGIPAITGTRVLEMTGLESGALNFRFEAAVQPEVKLGQYKGVAIHPSFDTDRAQLAIAAAAANLEIELPTLIVERKLDTLATEKKAELLESSSVNAAADMHAVLARINHEDGTGLGEDELWAQALRAAEIYTESGSMDFPEYIAALAKVSGADSLRIDAVVTDRMAVRQMSDADELGDEIFEAFLRITGSTEEKWRKENFTAAEEQCRIDYLLTKVVEVEPFEVTQEEMETITRGLSIQYEVPPDQIIEAIGREAVEYQVKVEKARQLIIDTAVEV